MGVTRGRALAALAVCTAAAGVAAAPAEARPTDGQGPAIEPKYGKAGEAPPKCFGVKKGQICIHRATTGPQKASADDVNRTRKAFARAWKVEVGLGFRAPLSDKTGGRGSHEEALDVYLADVGAEGTTLGYCRPTAPAKGVAKGKAAKAAYCVVDDDFKEFTGAGADAQSPTDLLAQTAAHELFHAVQYAYNASPAVPAWLREGTAVWMQRQVLPEQLQPYRYLDNSAISDPDVPLDSEDQLFEYGSWIFWQFLADRPGSVKPIQLLWSVAAKIKIDASAVAPVLKGLTGTSFEELLNEFAAKNYELAYDHADEILKRVGRPPEDATYVLSASYGDTGDRFVQMASKSSSYVRIVNGGTSTCAVTAAVPSASGVAATLLAGDPLAATLSLGASLQPGQSAILVLSNSEPAQAVHYQVRGTC